MASSKPKENGKTDAVDNTRKMLLFNERTDRSLHVELSQLERNRREIVRDLRKIQQIKSTLSEQLRTVIEHKARTRSISDTSIYSNGLRLPSVERNGGRRRFHSDIGPMDRLIANERCRLEKLGTRCESNLNAVNKSDERKCKEAKMKTQDDSNEDGHREAYRTNQELRNDIFIKSRFTQLGGKYVGKEVLDKRSSVNEKRRKTVTGNPGQNRAERIKTGEERIKKEIMEESEEDEISPKLSRLSISNTAVDENRSGLDTNGPNSETSSIAKNLALESITVQFTPLSNNTTIARDGQNAPQQSLVSSVKSHASRPPNRKTSAPSFRGPSNNTTARDGQNAPQQSPVSSVKSPPYRKTSARSVGGLDIDSMKTQQEALLPIIPPELRSKRRSKTLNSLEQAFMVCRDVSAESHDLKTERKRRFANLVNLVVKQRKVITAWEPLMRKIGEIHSDDEV